MTWSFGVLLFLCIPILIVAILFKRRSRRYYSELVAIENAKDEVGTQGSTYYRNKSAQDEQKLTDAKKTNSAATVAVAFSSAFAILMLLLSSVWFVPVQNVGIVTSFNNPTGRTTGSGIAVTFPWQSVQDFDASFQASDKRGDKNCSTVRIGSLATACVENLIQWQVQPTSAPRLYKSYRGNFDNLKKNYVEAKIQNALNAVFATYNPLSQVNLQTGQVSFDGAKLGQAVEEELNRTIGTDIRVISVSVPFVHHDSKTEDNIKQFQDVVAKARILDQQSANADKEKAIADKQKVFLTQEYIQNKCVDESVKMGVPPGLCLVGGGAIVDATTK